MNPWLRSARGGICRRPDRCGRAGRGRAGAFRRAALSDVRDAGRAHAGAGAARAPARSVARLQSRAGAVRRPGAGALPARQASGSSAISARPIRAAPPSGFLRWRASRGSRRRASRWSKATICAARCRRRTLPRARPTARSAARCVATIISANVYLGARPIARSARAGRRHRGDRARRRFRAGARSADARVRLARRRLGPPRGRHARGSSAGMRRADHRRLFRRSAVQDVPGMADIGYPIAEIVRDGGIVIGKPAGTGGRVDRLTVIEQMLYEIHDPAAYLAPDVVLDLTDVDGRGDRARPRPRQRRARQAGARRRSRPPSASMAACSARPRFPMPARMPRRAPGSPPKSIAARMHARARADVSDRCDRRRQRAWRRRRHVRARSQRGAGRHAAALRRAIVRCRGGRDSAGRSGGALLRGSGRRRRRAPADHAAARQRLLPDRAFVRAADASPCSGAAHEPAHREAARDRQCALRRQGQPAQHRAGLPRSGALRGHRAAGHRRARRRGFRRIASRRAWCATTCRSSPPSTSCSTTCWKAASTQASASTATASRCRSFCWTIPLQIENQETGS